ncbi:MAG: TolC family protein [Thermoanaerobaculia bacterium]
MSLRTPILVLMVLAATACTTIPRDAGLSSVRETVLERGGVELDVGARVDEILAEELDPNDVVAVALANNPRVRLMLTDLAIARAELIEASTIPNPILELEWRSPGRPHHPYELTLAQSILDLALLPRRRAAGRVAFEADTRRVAAEILAFAADARDAYWRLLAATRRIAFSRTTTEAALVAAQLAIRQHEAGNITDLDLERRQASYSRSRATRRTRSSRARRSFAPWACGTPRARGGSPRSFLRFRRKSPT